MRLQRLEAINFRNLTGAIEFSPGLNLVYGANAQGKSSWLEAVYLLATTKSFRTSYPKESLTHGAREAILRGAVARGNLTKDLQLLITDSVKQTFVNGKREVVTRYLGNLNAIAFTADEMQVVRGGPDARRRFLDRGIFFTLPAYLGTLNEYSRVLKQKNALLREASEAEDSLKFHDLIQPWNDQLVALGSEIHQARVNHVNQLRAHLNPELFQAEEITIRYKSSLEGRGDLGDYSNLLKERLNLRLKNEIAAGYSLVGPHRDDLEILCDGYEIARFGSSGQQRSALLILDIAQMSVYYQIFEEYPIFLIDDLDAELDRTRIEILLNHLDGRSQTIVSTSKRTIAERYSHRARTLLVQSGRVTEDQGLRNG
jgi:DNA replication and repair protein RecF